MVIFIPKLIENIVTLSTAGSLEVKKQHPRLQHLLRLQQPLKLPNPRLQLLLRFQKLLRLPRVLRLQYPRLQQLLRLQRLQRLLRLLWLLRRRHPKPNHPRPNHPKPTPPRLAERAAAIDHTASKRFAFVIAPALGYIVHQKSLGSWLRYLLLM